MILHYLLSVSQKKIGLLLGFLMVADCPVEMVVLLYQ